MPLRVDFTKLIEYSRLWVNANIYEYPAGVD